MAVESLLQPLRLGSLTLPNRIVMAPMTRLRADERGVPLPIVADYYAQRASAGLIITECVAVSVDGRGSDRAPGIFDPAQVAAWRRVVDAVHARGGRIVVQIAHHGRNPSPDLSTAFVSMASADIAVTIGAFVESAARAMDAGFDGVELQGGNGHLIDQFLHDGTNTRSDSFGGSFENRMRFLSETVWQISAAIGTDRLGVRLSPFAQARGVHDSRPLQLFTKVVQALDREGIGYLHLVEARAAAIELRDDIHQNGLNNAKLFRPHFRGPLISAGGYDATTAAIAIEDGYADAIAFGRAFIANPDFVERVANRKPLQPFDRSTFYTHEARGYIDYPTHR